MGEPEPFSWPEDWEAALPRVRERARHVCRQHGLDGHDADDVFQEVSVKLWLAAQSDSPHFASLDKVAAWAWAVALSIVLKEFRKPSRRRRIPIADLGELPGPEEGEGPGLPLTAYLAMITDALEREAMRLRADGARYREIAARLDVSVPTAFRLVRSARNTLRGRVDRD